MATAVLPVEESVVNFSPGTVSGFREMFDAYIIDRIKRERERESRHDQRPALHIQVPQHPTFPDGHPDGRPDHLPTNERRDESPRRGVVIIDFNI